MQRSLISLFFAAVLFAVIRPALAADPDAVSRERWRTVVATNGIASTNLLGNIPIARLTNAIPNAATIGANDASGLTNASAGTLLTEVKATLAITNKSTLITNVTYIVNGIVASNVVSTQ